jgi:uncharacterized protein YndB with AHSA1/START domain
MGREAMRRITDPTAWPVGPTRRQVIVAGALAIGGFGIRSEAGAAATGDEISHAAEAIHQEPLIAASRSRIYGALTDAKQFDKLIQYSAAIKTMPINHDAAALSARAGGAFSLFGGYVTGRFIELVPNELIVEAWRAGNWSPGVYSIARFQLVDQDAGTKIVFDHTGFPSGQAEHLAEGWQVNYWDPLRKLLA